MLQELRQPLRALSSGLRLEVVGRAAGVVASPKGDTVSFLSVVENIGKDILKGIEVSAPILTAAGQTLEAVGLPVGAVFVEAGTIIASLEAKNIPVAAETIREIVQSVATLHAAKHFTGMVSAPGNPGKPA